MLRHIAWFNEVSIRPRPEGGLTSDVPQVCRRCLAPARALEDMGIPCSVFGNLQDADPTEVSHHLMKLHADIVVIGKFEKSSLFPLAEAAKHQGCFVIVDLDDQDIKLLDLKALIKIADRLVAPSTATALAIHTLSGHKAIVIPDCQDDEDSPLSPSVIAKLWLEEFKKLKLKPPPCANTNVPEKH